MIIRFALSLILFFSISAGANEVFVIKNINISSSNKSASIARNEAIESGQMKAFRGLVKLHYPDAQDKISKIDPDDIFSLVEGYELSDERRSSSDYHAKLKVKFSRSHVDNLMRSIGVSFSGAAIKNKKRYIEVDEVSPVAPVANDTVSTSFTTLAIPVFIQDNKDYWLEDGNAWLDIWQEHDLSDKFVIPLVDIEDLRVINKNIISKNLIDLSSLLEKYNVNNIALYNLEDIKEGDNHRISLKVNYINKYHYSWKTHHFSDDAGGDISKLLNAAYDKVQKFDFNSDLDDCCKVSDDLIIVDPYMVAVEFPVNKISDWLGLQETLKNITYIDGVQLDKMTIRNYSFSFNSKISIDDLKEVFIKYGFSLEEKSNNSFVLTKASVNEYDNYEGLGQ